MKKAEPQRIDAFELWCWRRLLRIPCTARSNQSILKERTDAEVEAPVLWPSDMKSQLTGKDPDAGNDWGQKEKGQQTKRQLDGIIDSMDISLSKLQEIVKDRKAWCAVIHGVTKSWTRVSNWTTRSLWQSVFSKDCHKNIPHPTCCCAKQFCHCPINFCCCSEKEMATHSSTLAWRIPWREQPGRLQSMGLQSQTWLSNFTSVAKSRLTLLQSQGLKPARILCPWDFPDKNTGVGCHFLLQGIFLIQGLNPHLLHWQVGSLPLSHQGNPPHQQVEPNSPPLESEWAWFTYNQENVAVYEMILYDFWSYTTLSFFSGSFHRWTRATE